VKEVVGVVHVTIQRWVRWYEAGGLEEVGRHRLDNGVMSYEAWTPVQGQRLWEAVSGGRFRTIGEAMAWWEKELGVKVSYKKLYYWFRRWGYWRKVPGLMRGKADVQAQEGWKKGGYLQSKTF
jgi:transposase